MTTTHGFRSVSTRVLGAIAGCAILASIGCASIDTSRTDEARKAVSAAQQNTIVDPESPHMREALRRLQLAEDETRFQDVADHNAYLASAHSLVAVTRAEARVANEAKTIALREALGEAAAARRSAAEARAEAERARLAAMALASSIDAIMAEQTERGLVLTLGGVLFAFDSAELSSDAKFGLARVAGFLIALPGRQVLVEGFTDNVGTEEYNDDLSRKRADSVAALLVENGVDESRIVPDGYGMLFPVADNESAEGRERNRRVEVVILEPGESAASRKRVIE